MSTSFSVLFTFRTTLSRLPKKFHVPAVQWIETVADENPFTQNNLQAASPARELRTLSLPVHKMQSALRI
jgi:hypothetical protein